MRALLIILVVSAPLAARAADDPDEELARRHFEQGRAYYNADDYVHALEQFEAARRVQSRPALDYNIGRCHDRLEHWTQAIAAYRRYVDSVPTPSDAGFVRERIRILEERQMAQKATAPVAILTAPASPPAASSARRTGLIIGLSVGAAVVAGLVVGLAVGLRPSDEIAVNYGPVQATK